VEQNQTRRQKCITCTSRSGILDLELERVRADSGNRERKSNSAGACGIFDVGFSLVQNHFDVKAVDHFESKSPLFFFVSLCVRMRGVCSVCQSDSRRNISEKIWQSGMEAAGKGESEKEM
jgi:hypothetical protein